MININNTPWEKLTSSDILALLDNDNGESFFFEFKEDGVRNEQLHKEISAFANTYGGYIFLGITDKKDITGCVKWTEERMPYNDYLTIDKRYMDSLGLEFTADEIITELFHDVYSVMGIIDRMKKQDDE